MFPTRAKKCRPGFQLGWRRRRAWAMIEWEWLSRHCPNLGANGTGVIMLPDNTLACSSLRTSAVVLLLGIASGLGWVILGVCRRMTHLGSLLLAGLLCLILISPAHAQNDDPSESFLKAYMTAQQGEKLERDNQYTRALAKYRFAGSLLEELKKTHSEWQPAI